ncbi:hypothetical protein SRHO_G00314690 [Serrasalmus rhombeus]
MPFGLCNALATFQRVMNIILAGLIYKCCAVYLDDIVIVPPSFEQLVTTGGCLVRWCLRLQGLCINHLIQTRPDALSRNPQQVDLEPTDLLTGYAVVADLDLWSQTLVELTDKGQLQELRREGPVVADILESGPYRIVQKLSEVSYDLAKEDGSDMGVVHVVNLQPFHTWPTSGTRTISHPNPDSFVSLENSSSRAGDDSLSHNYSVEPEPQVLDKAIEEEAPLSEEPIPSSADLVELSEPLAHMFMDDTVRPVANRYDLRSRASLADTDKTDTDCLICHKTDSTTVASKASDLSVTDLDISMTPSYRLRPRRNQRVTAGWTVNRWTNRFHTGRLNWL